MEPHWNLKRQDAGCMCASTRRGCVITKPVTSAKPVGSARKVPCGACQTSKFECTPSSRPFRIPRKTDLAFRQNQNAPSVIKPKTNSNATIPTAHTEPDTVETRISKPTPATTQLSSDLSELPSVSLVDSDSIEHEGEPSLHAHSIAARDLLVQTLGNHSHVRNHPDMVAALSSLRHIVEVDKVEHARKKPKLIGMGEFRQTIYELKLPPTDIALDILRRIKERRTFTLSPPLAFVTYNQFKELCKTVFFRTEEYPTSTAVIVHGVLENLFQELKWSDKELAAQQQYDKWARLCRTNLEISISNLDILLPACMESAQALLIAASYCMEIAQASMCKSFVIHGCVMVQQLGWHRSASIKNDDEHVRRLKLVIFWMLYIIDKNLSLRLGQASMMQDDAIDLPFPPVDASVPFSSLSRIKLWADAARMMDLVYQRLFSPSALKQTDATRFLAVQQLLQQVEDIKPKTSDQDEFSQLVQDPDFAAAAYLRTGNELLLKSDEITYYALRCMIYRATPMTTSVNARYDPAVECIKNARAALDSHRSCTETFKGQTELWAIYLHWTILNTPFVPFTTLFSHVLTTHDRTDLARLQQFAESMSSGGGNGGGSDGSGNGGGNNDPTAPSQAAHKVSRLASLFVRVATVYVESREREAAAEEQREEEDFAQMATTSLDNDDTTSTTRLHRPLQQQRQQQRRLQRRQQQQRQTHNDTASFYHHHNQNHHNHNQQQQQQQQQNQTTTYSMPTWTTASFNPFLDALGFVEPLLPQQPPPPLPPAAATSSGAASSSSSSTVPMNVNVNMDGSGSGSGVAIAEGTTTNDNTTNLENWFMGNQHFMGLLEDDLTYLDPEFLPF